MIEEVIWHKQHDVIEALNTNRSTSVSGARVESNPNLALSDSVSSHILHATAHKLPPE